MSHKKVAARRKLDWRYGAPALLTVLLFFTICLSSNSTVKKTAALLTVLALVAVVPFFTRLRDRFRAPVIALALLVLMNGASTFYAVSGKFALYEFLKVLIAFCIALLMLALDQGEGEQAGLQTAAVLEGCTALMGLVSIDLMSTRLLSGPVLAVLGLFTPDYNGLIGLEAGVRMTSLFTNPNIFAGCAGIGVLLSLGLAVSSEGRARLFHLSCLFLNSLAFLLAFSMGASASIALAFLSYILFEARERRGALLLLMVETLALTALAAVLISETSFTAWSGPRPIPILCAVLGAAALCALDRFVGQRAAQVFARYEKGALFLSAGIPAALAVFVLLAWNLTGAVTLESGESIRRSAYLDPGVCTLTAQADAPVSVVAVSQNQQDTMMHTGSFLYNGPLSDAAFEVPEDSMVVYFTFQAQEDVHLEEVRWQIGSESGLIPLEYKLLPGFIANRLQGMFANQNAIQRLVFFNDGLKLFRRSPIAGLGIGAYENAIQSVQSFRYETKYAHNHYIQTLVETGAVGLILFAGLFVISMLSVFRARKAEKVHPLLPALGAALVFMAAHAAVEVVFSSYPYLPLAFGVIALTALCLSPAEAGEKQQLKARALLVSSALLGAFGVLLFCNMQAESLSERAVSMTDLEQAAFFDKFEWADYMLSYVVSSMELDVDENVRHRADQYAEKLSKVSSNTIPIYLAEYYFKLGLTQKGMEMIEKYVNYVSSDPYTWNQAFAMLEFYDTGDETYRSGVAHIYQLMQDWNAANMGKITLNETAAAYIAQTLG